MTRVVVLATFTDQGMRGVKDTAKRAKAFREMADSLGVTIKDIYWTMGSYDVVLIMEAAHDDAIASLLMKAGSLGNLRSETLRAFNEAEIDGLLSKI